MDNTESRCKESRINSAGSNCAESLGKGDKSSWQLSTTGGEKTGPVQDKPVANAILPNLPTECKDVKELRCAASDAGKGRSEHAKDRKNGDDSRVVNSRGGAKNPECARL